MQNGRPGNQLLADTPLLKVAISSMRGGWRTGAHWHCGGQLKDIYCDVDGASLVLRASPLELMSWHSWHTVKHVCGAAGDRGYMYYPAQRQCYYMLLVRPRIPNARARQSSNHPLSKVHVHMQLGICNLP